MSIDKAFAVDHQAAQEALPWLANGTLEGPERERVEAHLRGCAHCRNELELLKALRAAGPGAAPDCDPEAAWARMQARLDAPAVDSAPVPAPAAAPAAKVPSRWRTRIAANDGSWLRIAVALQCCLIAVLAALLLRPDDDAAYRGLGAAPAVRAGIVVAFRPDTPERELRRIVRDSGGQLSGGPTAGEAWLVNGDDPAAILARLRSEPAVVLAEPLGAENRP
jgi:anti-sigma factor RsiW